MCVRYYVRDCYNNVYRTSYYKENWVLDTSVNYVARYSDPKRSIGNV